MLPGVATIVDGKATVPFVNVSSSRLELSNESLCDLEVCSLVEANNAVSALTTQSQGHGETRLRKLLQTAVKATPLNYHSCVGEIVREYQDTMAIGEEPPGRIDKLPFKIETGDHPPIRSKPYRTPACHEQVIGEKIKQMLDQGIIREISRSSKCEVAQTQLVYLGHMIGNGTVEPTNNKLKAIQEVPRPETKKQVRSSIGLIGYYRKFVLNIASLAAPLTNLIKKGFPNKLKWKQEHDNAFKTFEIYVTL
ncbi:uncharacterized protein LOC135213387 [Macrobrachium nipponense]|uniref:uncharacterized protein LOC135213387 n=1 Tax=Macrobrachium nipponense TaxID=159736 RepID=UPI0030C7E7F2